MCTTYITNKLNYNQYINVKFVEGTENKKKPIIAGDETSISMDIDSKFVYDQWLLLKSKIKIAQKKFSTKTILS